MAAQILHVKVITAALPWAFSEKFRFAVKRPQRNGENLQIQSNSLMTSALRQQKCICPWQEDFLQIYFHPGAFPCIWSGSSNPNTL
jgi:hypothetical protein